MMVKRTFETIKVQMCGFDWAVTCVPLSRTQWEIAPLTSGPRVRLSSVTSGSGGGVRTAVNKERGCYGVTELQSDLRFIAAKVLELDVAAEWKHASATRHRWTTVDGVPSQFWSSTLAETEKKEKNCKCSSSSSTCIFIAIQQKAPSDSVHNATFSILQPSRVITKKKKTLKVPSF